MRTAITSAAVTSTAASTLPREEEIVEAFEAVAREEGRKPLALSSLFFGRLGSDVDDLLDGSQQVQELERALGVENAFPVGIGSNLLDRSRDDGISRQQ